MAKGGAWHEGALQSTIFCFLGCLKQNLWDEVFPRILIGRFAVATVVRAVAMDGRSAATDGREKNKIKREL